MIHSIVSQECTDFQCPGPRHKRRPNTSIRAILVFNALCTLRSVVALVSFSKQLSNVATRVRYPAAYARQSVGVLLLPSTSRKYEEEVGTTSLARSSFPSEPATVSV